jgi:hypothetical protein
MEKVEPGGILAVQMPRNFEAPSHLLIAETALNGPWRGRLEHLVTPPPVKGPGFYHGLLAPQSANIDIWETEYLQVLEGENPVKEWTKGTWLTRCLRGGLWRAGGEGLSAQCAGPDAVPVPAAVHGGAAQALRLPRRTMKRPLWVRHLCQAGGLERNRKSAYTIVTWPDFGPRQFGLGLVVRGIVYCHY